MTYVTERGRALAGRPTIAVDQGRQRHDSHVYRDEPQAAEYLLGDRRKARRLKDLRQRGGGPRYVRIGTAVRYRQDWLDKWAEDNAVSSTSEETARRRRCGQRGHPQQPSSN